jgi:predicted Holliday junction resolvase-like endonuclease
MLSLESLLIIPLLILIVVLFVYRAIFKQQTAQIARMADDYNKLLSQKKSSEVRIGQIGEQFAPFLEEFPYNPKDARFLGSPIDYVVFDFEGDQIVLVEFKTGNSYESQRQKAVKRMVEEGKFKYELIRVKGD